MQTSLVWAAVWERPHRYPRADIQISRAGPTPDWLQQSGEQTLHSIPSLGSTVKVALEAWVQIFNPPEGTKARGLTLPPADGIGLPNWSRMASSSTTQAYI